MRDLSRRGVIGLVGGAAAWPLAAGAQRFPVIGFLNGRGSDDLPQFLAAFHRGLKDTGFVDGQNVTIEYRWAENQYDRLPGMAGDLVRRQVTVLTATTTPAALAAKAATSVIPIVFETGGDPIRLGLVRSLNQPGGNITGVTQLNVEVAPKRLELLHELVPTASDFALLVNPADPALAEANTRDIQAAADALGLHMHVLHASTERDLDATFAKLVQLRTGGLVIGSDTFFLSRSRQLASLAVQHAVAAIFETREFVATGGLMSYGGSFADSYRVAGVYTGRILKGEKPSELPVQRSTKVELFLNLKTANALGIIIPFPLSGRADEVIE